MLDLSGFTQLKGHGFGQDSFLEAYEKKFDDFTILDAEESGDEGSNTYKIQEIIGQFSSVRFLFQVVRCLIAMRACSSVVRARA